jgi:hypothetical protein
MEPKYSNEYWYWYDRVYLQDPNITRYRYDDEKMWEAWKAGYKAGQERSRLVDKIMNQVMEEHGEFLKTIKD